MAKTAKKASTKAKAKPAPEPEPDEIEDDDLEELEEDEVEEKAPAKSAVQAVTFGVSDLAKHLQAQGHKVDARGLRTLIRKMARDGSGRVEREIVAGNRSRYDWPKGLKDPEVKKIIAAFNAGELEEDKQQKLAALKERKAAKDKAAGKVKGKKSKAGKKGGKASGKAAAAAADDDEDLELDDDE
jgi:hypothetical protein